MNKSNLISKFSNTCFKGNFTETSTSRRFTLFCGCEERGDEGGEKDMGEREGGVNGGV